MCNATSDSSCAAYWLCDVKEFLLVVLSLHFPNYESIDFSGGLRVTYIKHPFHCGHSTKGSHYY